jgi:uncharacterized protein (TIGR02594 family)
MSRETFCKRVNTAVNWTVWTFLTSYNKKPFVPPAPDPTPNPTPPASLIVPPWMETAVSLQGVKEDLSAGSNPIIMDWAKTVGGQVQREYYNDGVPWCGLFTDYCLVKNGYPGQDQPLWARNWAKYGIDPNALIWGSIAVFTRDGGGHVGYLVGADAQALHILGGNQSDAVNVQRVSRARFLALRWPSTAADIGRVTVGSTFNSVARIPEEFGRGV